MYSFYVLFIQSTLYLCDGDLTATICAQFSSKILLHKSSIWRSEKINCELCRILNSMKSMQNTYLIIMFMVYPQFFSYRFSIQEIFSYKLHTEFIMYLVSGT